MYKFRSEYACMKEEKEERERIARAVTKRDIKYKDYDGSMMSDRLWSAGKASYVERNQDMINASDYCVFIIIRSINRPNENILNEMCVNINRKAEQHLRMNMQIIGYKVTKNQ